MIRFHLLPIVFVVIQLRFASSSSNGTHFPLSRYIAMEFGRTNSTSVIPPDYHISRNGSNQSGTGVRFATEAKIYDSRKVRPVQQLFYNIYIQDSPSINVNNVIHAHVATTTTTTTESTWNALRYGEISDDDIETTTTENVTVTEKGSTENGVVLEADEESMKKMLDAVSSELFGTGNETRENKKPLQFKIVNVSHGKAENVGEDAVGNVWRAFMPESATENEEENARSEINRRLMLRYPDIFQNVRDGNVMQIPQDTGRSQFPQDKPIMPAMARSADIDDDVTPDREKQLEYPAYGRHSYHEIVKKLYNKKSEKKDEKMAASEIGIVNSEQG